MRPAPTQARQQSGHSTLPTNPLNTSRWKKLRDHLVHDHSACALCGATPGRHLLDLDHITPRAHGGDPYNTDNLRVLCRNCNRSRGAKLRQFFTPPSTPRAATRFSVCTGSMRVGPGGS